MKKAVARHILVNDEDLCLKLKSKIEAGTDFTELAHQYSKCPSGKRGGDLGRFAQGTMVSEFDQVVFSEQVPSLQGPVKTAFGYHLIEILERN